MNDARTIDTLKTTIANLDKLIAHAGTSATRRAKAQSTRDELQSILDRLTSHAARPAR